MLFYFFISIATLAKYLINEREGEREEEKEKGKGEKKKKKKYY